MFKTPRFWFRKSFISIALAPLALIYFILGKLRILAFKSKKLNGKFIICVGNITVGGSGKTPLCIAIHSAISNVNSICFLSKGYGRKSKGFFETKFTHNAFEIGDEPKILQKHGKVYVYSNYRKQFEEMQDIKENVIILDDGLQNPSIQKDLSILLLDSRGFGNGMIFPSGPMRETFANAVKKADCIAGYFSSFECSVPYFQLEVEYYSNLLPQKVIAFSGLGNNQKFLKSLELQGFDVVNFFEFSDHYQYTKHDIENILQTAKNLEFPVITTEKDFVKLEEGHQALIYTLQIKTIMPQQMIDFVQQRIKQLGFLK